IRSLRRASRPPYRNAGDYTNRFVLFSLSPSCLGRMAQAAKTLGVTLNDLFLARLMQAVALLTPKRTQAPRRRGIALGCVVNIRKDLELSHRRAFGLFLGFFVVAHQVPASISLADLAQDIGRQTLRIKRHRLYLAAALELACGGWMSARFSPERRRNLYV